MYAYIEGTVAYKNSDSLVIDANGVGYLIYVSGATLSAAPATGQRMRVFTVLNVREDAMELYGFYSMEEKHMYERLRSVSGVGSRTAIQILSVLSVKDLSIALVAGDAAALTKVPGIGKKTAQRLVLELKDKIDDSDLSGTSVSPVIATRGIEAEAIAALTALGYGSSEAAKAVSQFSGQFDESDRLIFAALKSLGS